MSETTAVSAALIRGLERAEAEIRVAEKDLVEAQDRREQEQRNVERFAARVSEWETKRLELRTALDERQKEGKG